MAEAFKNATNKPVNDVERGDIILFKDLKSGEWQRGIVYRTIMRPDNAGVSGFLTVPVDTVTKNVNPTSPFPFLTETNATMVEKAGGNPQLHKLLLAMNLRTVVNVPRMTGVDNKNEIRALGSFHGEPFMKKLTEEIERHHYAHQLFKDGKPLDATERRIIVPVIHVIDEAKGASHARRQAYQEIQHARENFGGTSVGGKIAESVQTLTLQSAVESGHIEQRSYNFLRNAAMADGSSPKTLMDAFHLVTETPERLAAVYGLGSKGKIYQSIIAEVTGAVSKLSPKEP